MCTNNINWFLKKVSYNAISVYDSYNSPAEILKHFILVKTVCFVQVFILYTLTEVNGTHLHIKSKFKYFFLITVCPWKIEHFKIEYTWRLPDIQWIIRPDIRIRHQRKISEVPDIRIRLSGKIHIRSIPNINCKI